MPTVPCRVLDNTLQTMFLLFKLAPTFFLCCWSFRKDGLYILVFVCFCLCSCVIDLTDSEKAHEDVEIDYFVLTAGMHELHRHQILVNWPWSVSMCPVGHTISWCFPGFYIMLVGPVLSTLDHLGIDLWLTVCAWSHMLSFFWFAFTRVLGAWRMLWPARDQM